LLDPGTPEIEALAAYGKHERMALWFHDIIEPEASDASAHGRYTP
jgi:hypothetical protein